jgi:murein DD-endopeptidase MepM/ murein hydrolase activator NlpD
MPPLEFRPRHHIGGHRRTAPAQRRLWDLLTHIGLSCGVVVCTAAIATTVLVSTPDDAGAVDGLPVAALPAAGPTVAAAVPGGDVYTWPVAGTPLVTRRFQPPPQRWLAGHRGVDLAGEPGLVVRAAGPGVVHFAGSLAGRGVVSIQHPSGFRTTYEPIRPIVAAGDRVRTGDVIGRLATGHRECPVTACLHWGLRLGGTYLDPLSLLGLGRVRLLPMVSPEGRTA